jgi:hypothetical protein
LDKFFTGNAQSYGYVDSRIPQPQTNYKTMKLFITALCASMLVIPMSYASDCEKGKCDKEKEEGTLLSDCGKCEDKKDKDCEKKECDKEEGTLLADCGKCEDKKDKDCEKKECDKEEGTMLADCGECEKKKDCEKKECDKEDGTVA